MISKNGMVKYYGRMYVDNEGSFKSNISSKTFIGIMNNFKKANFLKLKDTYTANHTDDATITTTFIKNGKILKTVSDYGRESPVEMQWATLPVMCLNQLIKLEPIDEPRKFVNLGSGAFVYGNKICNLTKSECFYLKSLLQDCKETKQNFKPKYLVKYWENDTDKEVQTDGQYFKFEISKGKFVTLNLGFNFLEINNLLKRTRQKTEYD